MESILNICKLNKGFYDKYPYNEYPEILAKHGRPYTCLLIEWNNCFICIPFRSSIKHSEAFLFKNTKRSRRGRSGLDYKKLIITNDIKDIDTLNVTVDTDEYNIARNHKDRIVQEVLDYISTYIAHISGKHILNEKEFYRKYMFSTIGYFIDSSF